jgi:hypothetical protein
MRMVMRLILCVLGAAAGMAAGALLTGLIWLPVRFLVGDDLAAGTGLVMAMLLWLTVAALGLGLWVGGWVGYRWPDRLTVPGEAVPIELMCAGCGYNLRGSASGQCPECGRAIDATQRRRIADAEPW